MLLMRRDSFKMLSLSVEGFFQQRLGHHAPYRVTLSPLNTPLPGKPECESLSEVPLDLVAANHANSAEIRHEILSDAGALAKRVHDERVASCENARVQSAKRGEGH
eukprot:1076112-Rhodomonas_salina.1